MSYVLVLTILLGTEITTAAKGFDTPYECFYDAHMINTIGIELTGPFERFKGAETLARCYRTEH